MKVNNLVQLIEDYNEISNILLDDCGISEVIEDIQYKCKSVKIGEFFCLNNVFVKNNRELIKVIFHFKLSSEDTAKYINYSMGCDYTDNLPF